MMMAASDIGRFRKVLLLSCIKAVSLLFIMTGRIQLSYSLRPLEAKVKMFLSDTVLYLLQQMLMQRKLLVCAARMIVAASKSSVNVCRAIHCKVMRSFRQCNSCPDGSPMGKHCIIDVGAHSGMTCALNRLACPRLLCAFSQGVLYTR